MSKAAIKVELPSYVGYAEIAEATGIDRRTIQRLMERGKFPKPDALPTKENRWRLSVVTNWLEQRNAEQLAALSDSAVTDPAKLKPDQIVDTLQRLERTLRRHKRPGSRARRYRRLHLSARRRTARSARRQGKQHGGHVLRDLGGSTRCAHCSWSAA